MGNISEGVCYFARIIRVGYEKILGCQCKVSFFSMLIVKFKPSNLENK